MATGTLLVLDASLPGGLIEGTGDTRYAQTMAFTTIVFFSLFTVFNARSDERSAFVGLFSNAWLWGAVLVSSLLQVAVIHVPFLQQAFSTVALSSRDWLTCAAVGSSVLWLSESKKLLLPDGPIDRNQHLSKDLRFALVFCVRRPAQLGRMFGGGSLLGRRCRLKQYRGEIPWLLRKGSTATRLVLATGLASVMSVVAYAQFGGPPPEVYTPAEGSKDLKSVLFNWPWHMGMLRGIEEHELAVTLEYRGEGTIQVNGQPCAIKPYEEAREGELGTSGYRISNAYQFAGSRTQINCTLPNGRTYSNVEVVSGSTPGMKTARAPASCRAKARPSRCAKASMSG